MRRSLSTLVALLAIGLAPLTAGAQPPTPVAGVPARLVGVHGPSKDLTGGALELVGHVDLAQRAGAPALGNNGGVALIGGCAYVGRWHDYGGKGPQYGVQIVDISKPAAPRRIGVIASTAITGAVSREIRSVDLPGFKVLTVQTFGKYLDESASKPGLDSLQYYTFPSGRCDKPVLAGSVDLHSIRPHEFYQWLDPNPAHNVDGHPRLVDLVTSPLSGADGAIVDASRPDAPRLMGAWHGGEPAASATESNLSARSPAGAGRYTHSVTLSADGRRAFLSQWDGGFLTVDSTPVADANPYATFGSAGAMSIPYLYPQGSPGNTHSAVALPSTNDVVVGDEIYVTTDGCPFGWMRILDAGNATTPPRQIGEFKLPENTADACDGSLSADRNSLGLPIDGTFSMHNQTVVQGFALASWYGGGLRAIDLRDPASPKEAGFFVPKPAVTTASVPDTSAPVYGKTDSVTDDWWVSTWSYPIVRKGLIFVSDIRSGLYILRARPGTPLAKSLAKVRFAEGNSNAGMFIR